MESVEVDRPETTAVEIEIEEEKEPKEDNDGPTNTVHVQKEGSKQFFVLVRHAQRADDPTMSWEMKKKQQEIIIESDP